MRETQTSATGFSARHIPRVYAPEHDLAPGMIVVLPQATAHHLRHVLRLQEGDWLCLFSPHAGEFRARVSFSGKRDVAAVVEDRLRPPLTPAETADIWLLAPPLKKDAMDVMIEKAGELGASRYVPVTVAHGAVHRINQERLWTQSIEASAQSGRLDVMEIAPLRSLADVLRDWPRERDLFLALERSAAPPLSRVLAPAQGRSRPAAILIGPEGGFSTEERDRLQAYDFITPVSLGVHILRAETAAIAALAVFAVRDEKLSLT